MVSAAFALTTALASAQAVSAQDGDLILGFQITKAGVTAGVTGDNSNLEVDLGSFGNFTTSSSATFTSVTATDLSSTYGSSWASSQYLTWGVAGTNGDNANFDATYSKSSGPSSSASKSSTYALVAGLGGGLNGATAESDSATAGVVQTSQASSYTGELTVQGSNTYATDDFKNFVGRYVTDVNGGSTAGAIGSIDLYALTTSSSTPTELGVFSLASDGTFTYNGVNAAAVPEPSAYALGVCAVLLFLVLRRRQSVS